MQSTKKKPVKLDDIKKFAFLKNGIGIEGQKVFKQVRDQRNGVQVLLENENKSKSICYPYSDCYQPLFHFFTIIFIIVTT